MHAVIFDKELRNRNLLLKYFHVQRMKGEANVFAFKKSLSQSLENQSIAKDIFAPFTTDIKRKPKVFSFTSCTHHCRCFFCSILVFLRCFYLLSFSREVADLMTPEVENVATKVVTASLQSFISRVLYSSKKNTLEAIFLLIVLSFSSLFCPLIFPLLKSWIGLFNF